MLEKLENPLGLPAGVSFLLRRLLVLGGLVTQSTDIELNIWKHHLRWNILVCPGLSLLIKTTIEWSKTPKLDL